MKILKREVPSEFYGKDYYNGGGGRAAYSLTNGRCTSFANDRIRVLQKYAPKGAKILDIGSGPANLTQLVNENNLPYSMCSVDISKEAAEIAFKRGIKTHKVGSAYNLPYGTESFDFILMPDIIEHLEKPEEAIAEAKRVLVQGGKLYIATFDRYSPLAFVQGLNVAWKKHSNKPLTERIKKSLYDARHYYLLADKSHVWEPSKSDMRALLTKANFQNIKIRNFTHLAKYPWIRKLLGGAGYFPGGSHIEALARKPKVQ